MPKKIREQYIMEKECKHSWRMKPEDERSALSGMSIYLPKSVAPTRPERVTITVEIPE